MGMARAKRYYTTFTMKGSRGLVKYKCWSELPHRITYKYTELNIKLLNLPMRGEVVKKPLQNFVNVFSSKFVYRMAFKKLKIMLQKNEKYEHFVFYLSVSVLHETMTMISSK